MTTNNTRMLAALYAALPRRRTQAGQSLIAAIIVLFLLLVLGAAFVALVGNNLRNARQTARRNSADFYAEAGIRFMDQQLTSSAEGADWRPVPDCLDPKPGNCSTNSNISPQDPDYFWLKSYDNNGTPDNLNDDTGGYTRINFGGDTQGSPGGRALIRVTYRPEPVSTDTTVTPSEDAAVRKLIRLESIGRVGVITPTDPTTFNNTQQVSLRRELVAYKEIGITDYLRYFTNKDNKPTNATLGAANQVFDAPDNGTGPTRPLAAPVLRDIESYYIGGGIRSNASLTFYGVNRLVMNPQRGEGLMVSGLVSLANVPGSVTQAQYNNPAANPTITGKPGNPARVTLQTALTGAAVNVLPSTSNDFNTYAGMVRDNPAGSDTQGLPRNTVTAPTSTVESNLRSVPRAGVPLLDAASASGVTRYRSLTRDSAPLPSTDTGGVAVQTANAGVNGWGQNLYLSNSGDIQSASNIASQYSLRTDWLNPAYGQSAGYWKKDFVYTPPGVTITLTPRYMVITRSGDQIGPANARFRDRFRFRLPNTGQAIQNQTIVRYTYDNNVPGMANPPTYNVGENIAPGARFPGYPATYDNNTGYYTSNFVIYAEGNVRIRGVAGGYDPETAAFFKRHLTVVSGGTIYVDGNLLRDNIPSTATGTAAAVRGQSSIALLAHDYVAVNTSQFLATQTGSQVYGEQDKTYAFSIGRGQQYNFTMERGPVDANNTPPSSITNYPQPAIFFRHGTAGVGPSGDAEGTAGKASINLSVNGPFTTNAFSFNGSTTLDLNAPAVNAPVYVDQAFTFQALPQTNFLYGFGGQTGRYPAASAQYLELGTPNELTIAYDTSRADSSQDYFASRIGIAPLDVRIEAVMYAQEGSFFIIPGPWLNPTAEDTYEAYIAPSENNSANITRKRAEDSASDDPANPLKGRRVDPAFPFYRQPQDIRITFYGAIAENLPAEVGDQSAWLEKWGWIPRYQGSTGLESDPTTYGSTTANGDAITTIHGPLSQAINTLDTAVDKTLKGPGKNFANADSGNGIIYEYDTRASAPYRQTGPAAFTPIRPNPYRPEEPLPIVPSLPVAPGLLYVGERPVQPQ